MKHQIRKLYESFADNLVEFSRQHGARSWLVFLFVFALIVAMSSSGLSTEMTLVHEISSTPEAFTEINVSSAPVSPQSEPELSQDRLPKPTSPYLKTVQQCDRNQETRGVWLTNVDSDVLFAKKNTRQAIANLARLNFNTLYPAVWNWGHTLYPSPVAEAVTGIKIDPHPGFKNRDVLQEIVEEGHAAQMSVIPWFEFGFMAPADSTLATLHPEWLVKKSNGSTIWWEGKTHKRVWLNPLHPEVQKFITDLVVELVANYDVDGIQVDDHFGYPAEFGYDDYTVALYQQEHQGKQPPSDAKDPDWIRWRADKITAYMKTLFTAIKASNPDAIVSVSPNPQKFSLNSFLLDWNTWRKKGLIEELIVQVYRPNQTSFIHELSQPEMIAAQKHIPVSIGILSGLKGRPVLSGQLKRQVQIARDRKFAGVSFFFYESLWNLARESPESRKETLSGLFKQPVGRQQQSCRFISHHQ